jgi:hypothetical protein
MAALLRGLLELWPLAGHQLEVSVAHTLVPAARQIVTALEGTAGESRLPAGGS